MAGEFAESIWIQVCIVHVFNFKSIHAEINPAFYYISPQLKQSYFNAVYVYVRVVMHFAKVTPKNSWKKIQELQSLHPNSASAQKVFVLKEIRKKQLQSLFTQPAENDIVKLTRPKLPVRL